MVAQHETYSETARNEAITKLCDKLADLADAAIQKLKQTNDEKETD